MQLSSSEKFFKKRRLLENTEFESKTDLENLLEKWAIAFFSGKKNAMSE